MVVGMFFCARMTMRVTILNRSFVAECFFVVMDEPWTQLPPTSKQQNRKGPNTRAAESPICHHDGTQCLSNTPEERRISDQEAFIFRFSTRENKMLFRRQHNGSSVSNVAAGGDQDYEKRREAGIKGVCRM